MNRYIDLQHQSTQNDKKTKDNRHKKLFTNKLQNLSSSPHPQNVAGAFSVLFCPFPYSVTSNTRFKTPKAIACKQKGYTLSDKKLYPFAGQVIAFFTRNCITFASWERIN